MSPQISGDAVLKTGEVAALFQVHPGTVIKWVRAGKLDCFYTIGGHRRFRGQDVLALLSPDRQAEFAEDARRRVPGAGR